MCFYAWGTGETVDLFEPSIDCIEIREQVVHVLNAERLCVGCVGRTENK